AFAAGDPEIISRLIEVRKHLGLMMPAPVQAAALAALMDDSHVAAQRDIYEARRDVLRDAVTGAGLSIDHSDAGLYLWATRGEDCWATVNWFASLGIVVAPGSFYGSAGAHHVRIALTASDDRVAAAVSRLAKDR
ncbi:MAG: aminotransferase class I/II-fold pyridoxal phosphate-dependent enzyme, partial [Demequina sp.]